MRKFKKAMAVVLASAMCISAAACGKSETTAVEDSTESTTVSSDSASGNDAADASGGDACRVLHTQDWEKGEEGSQAPPPDLLLDRVRETLLFPAGAQVEAC